MIATDVILALLSRGARVPSAGLPRKRSAPPTIRKSSAQTSAQFF
ncbi:hypothetical protein NB311A_00670 [Nitrobacter sp. Nb-311A]|nr:MULTISPECIES: hypothetical protein [unclassified Nitrobacter]EAQ34193.1 hypothetical protein NB311A_00670 [Nitrobacter sp. Nb-311A]